MRSFGLASGFASVCAGAVLALCTLLLLSCSEEAGPSADAGPDGWPVALEGQRGPLEVRVRIPEGAADALGLGRPFELSLEATWPKDRQLELIEPRLEGRFGLLRVRGREATEELPGGGRRWRFTLDAERSGTISARFPAITALEPKEGAEEAPEEYRVQLDPLRLEVVEAPAVARADLASLRATGELPPRPTALQEERPLWHWMIALAGLLLVCGAGLWAWRRHLRKPAPLPAPIDPELEAQSALDALEGSDLLVQGRQGDFYLELTRIVRRFLERTTAIDAEELTTEEFLRHAEASGDAISPDRRRALGDFLAAADLVKFAGANPTHAEIGSAVAAARGFCRKPAAGPAHGPGAEEARA